MKRSKKNSLVALFVVIVAVVVLFFLRHRSPQTQKQYTFEEIQRGDLANIVSSTGTMEAVGTVEVGTQISGVIDRLYVDFNDRVKKGQVLAVLDTVMLRASVLDARANYEKAVAQLEEARSICERNLKLFEKELISEAEFLPHKVRVKTQQATLKSADAALIRAEQNLKYAVIRSPIDGTVIQRSVEAGQTVAASLQAPTLFVIAEDLSDMEIHAQVDESDIGQIKTGQCVVFEVQAYPDRQFSGTVRQVRLQPEVIQNVVNYTVVINAGNEERVLLPGMTATVDFYVEEKKDVLLVPNTALSFQPDAETVRLILENRRHQRETGVDSLRQQRLARLRSRFADQQIALERQNFARVWFLDESGELAMAALRPGTTDGKYTEVAVSRRLREGQRVITGWQEEQHQRDKNTQQRSGGRRMPPPLF
jgi:HlyD family secretion protein